MPNLKTKELTKFLWFNILLQTYALKEVGYKSTDLSKFYYITNIC